MRLPVAGVVHRAPVLQTGHRREVLPIARTQATGLSQGPYSAPCSLMIRTCFPLYGAYPEKRSLEAFLWIRGIRLVRFAPHTSRVASFVVV